MEQHYLRIEGVNLTHVLDDTAQISVVLRLLRNPITCFRPRISARLLPDPASPPRCFSRPLEGNA